MTSESFFKKFYLFRAVAVAVAMAAILFGLVKCYSHTLDIEFRGPEWEGLEREVRDQENRRAAERVYEGSTDRRDVERTREYERDHGA